MIVNNYDYPDTCIISRSVGDVDPITGNEIATEIYSGVCEIQYGSSGNTALQTDNYQSKPSIFIPISNIEFKINDIVTVTSLNNRISNYTIGQFESLAEFDDTCIWLKGGVE